jgi:uncharacterized membrane protein YphA (DoxX/SURF4 family)
MQRVATVPIWVLVFARLGLGTSFLFSDHGSGAPGELARFLGYAQHNGYGWYADLVRAVVVPHIAAFETLVLVGELYVGLALILGLTTRLACAVAMFLVVNYLCAKGAMPWRPGIDQSDFVLAVVVLVTGAGRYFGLDRVLRARFPRVPLW